VQKANFGRLGNIADLATFLFGRERTSLEAYRPILFDVQDGLCLYCRRSLAGPSQGGTAHVDHFVPWRRYPLDVGQNFILAHDACNSAKTDYLAAEPHLETWCERNRSRGGELEERLAAAGLPSDARAAEQVARWAYARAERTGGTVWLTGKVLKRLDPRWCLALAAAHDYGYQSVD
jgi:5-methylcytosine-specific restriction endonuclease McrA